MKNIFSLNHQVAVYVPSTQGLDGKVTPAEHKQRVAAVAGKLSELFGGATSYKAQGYYKAKNGKLIIETVEIVLAFSSDTDLEEKSQELLTYTQEQTRAWEQESVLLEIDNKAMFIEQ